MRKIFIISPLALFLLFVLYNVFFYRPACRFLIQPRLNIDTVRYGTFSEYIPVTGTWALDSVSKSVSVKAQIDKLYLSRILPGLKASAAVDNRDYVLTLTAMDTVLTEGRFNVALRFDEEVPSLRPDRSVRLRLALSPPVDVIQISVGGFYKDTGGSFVYVVTNDGLVMKRNVVLGRKNTDCFEVLSGLTAGEAVITSSYENFDKKDTLQFSQISALYE